MVTDRSQFVRNMLIRLKKAFSIRTDTELAKRLGITQGAIGNWKKRGSIDYDIIREKMGAISFDYLRNGNEPYFLDDRDRIIEIGKDCECEELKIQFEALVKENKKTTKELNALKNEKSELNGHIKGLQWVLKQTSLKMEDDVGEEETDE